MAAIGSPSAPRVSASSTSQGGRQPLTNEDGHGRGRAERRAVQLPRAAAGASRARPSPSHAAPTPRCCRTCGRSTASACPSTSTACSPSPSGTAAAGGPARARSDGQEAALLLGARRRPVLRLRAEGAAGDPRLRAAAEPRGAAPLPELQARSASADDLRGRPHAAAGAPARVPARARRRWSPATGPCRSRRATATCRTRTRSSRSCSRACEPPCAGA